MHIPFTMPPLQFAARLVLIAWFVDTARSVVAGVSQMSGRNCGWRYLQRGAAPSTVQPATQVSEMDSVPSVPQARTLPSSLQREVLGMHGLHVPLVQPLAHVISTVLPSVPHVTTLPELLHVASPAAHLVHRPSAQPNGHAMT